MDPNGYSRPPGDKLLQNQAQLLHRLRTSNSELSGYRGGHHLMDNARAPTQRHDSKIKSATERSLKNENVLKDVLVRRKKDLKDELAIYRTDRRKLDEEREKLHEETEKMQRSKDKWRLPNYNVLDPIEPSSGQYKLSEEPLAMHPNDMEAYAIRTEAKIPKLVADIERRRREVDMMRTNPQHLDGWSYEPHQSQTYHMVRDILVEVADGIMLFEPDKWKQDRLTAKRVLDQEEKKILEHKQQLLKERICQLLVEEIVLEVSAKLSQEIAEEHHSTKRYIRAMTQLMVINSAEAIATKKNEGRDEADPAYSLVTGTYHQMVKERQKKRERIWMHSQKLQYIGEDKSDIPVSGDVNDEDIKVLHFQDADVLQDRRNDELPAAFRIYRQKELEYWKNMSVRMDEVKVVRRTKGIEMTSLSPDHRLLACGYSCGDILVYDLWTSPVQLMRLIANDSIYNDPIISFKWSLDGMRLLSINESGSLEIWSMAPGGVTKKDMKDFEFVAGRENMFPQQMTLFALLTPDDYKFKQGPLAEGGTETTTLGPSLSCFYPSQTLLGTQNEFFIGFDNGDILKCNVEPLIAAASNPDELTSEVNTFPKVIPPNQPNYIGQDIPADLFRCHQHPLVLLRCIGNRGNLLSVDANGYINVWEYSKKQLSHFGWFEPLQRYRLVMDERTFVSIDDQTPQVMFNEDQYISKKKSTQKVLTAKLQEDRKQMEKEIAWLMFRTVAWHRKVENGTKVEIWRPQHVPDDGCDFHVIVRNALNSLLVSYTRVKYQEIANSYSAMLDCKMSEDGNLLIFMLLFPKCPPKDAHISFVFIDVNEMNVRPYRINVRYSLSALEFTRCLEKGTCSFHISRPYNVTGAPYLFVKVLDFLHVYSIESGALVMLTSIVPADCLTILPKHLALVDESMIDLACTQGRMIIINYGNKQPVVKVVDISDNNIEDSKRNVHASFKSWKKNIAPSNTWLWSNRDLLDGQDNRHIAVYFRRVVLQLADTAMQMIDGKFEDGVMEENVKQDRLNQFPVKNQEPPADDNLKAPKEGNNKGSSQQDQEGPSTE